MARESPTLFVNTALAALFVLSCVILVIRWWTVPSGFGHLQHRAWKGVMGGFSGTDAAWESLERMHGRGAAERAWEGPCPRSSPVYEAYGLDGVGGPWNRWE